MLTLDCKYNQVKVFTDELEPSAEGQIRAMCEQPFMKDSKIRIMPDVHAGKGCTIGTTMTIRDTVVPSMVSVDIGCGMLTVKLEEKRLNLPKLDSFIRQNIPHGRDVRERPHRSHGRIRLEELRCYKKIDTRRGKESLGTLGGGNHFIEVNKDEEGSLYLVIHTGSRNMGLRVVELYQKKAYNAVGGRKQTEIPYELSPLTGQEMEDYLWDMALMQRFAELNRQIIKEVILDGMKLHETESFSTIHNYIDTEAMILRKGAVSAKAGETLLIPINMQDGSLLCTGLGNEDWNYSAPHGAGRLYSRKDAENNFTLSQFKKEMEGIFTTSVAQDTLDESPMAYKPMESILRNIEGTVRVEKIIRPIYNFKASEHPRKRQEKK
ncbi:RNA-splicing ligase RtcB [Anaerotruncus colihominis]|uniref:3'-phosphate/5'-hydroxy nucleic acid ligase n=1 Tax=Anaerotruncus colihominis TaxID=169435 RepID=A0A845RBZ2_9FIRM|nr:RtcB family protein [Anaerotruncus colihominis]NBI77344.1 RNA-splicing ligase RtcB [Anaerotruncus colihominis]